MPFRGGGTAAKKKVPRRWHENPIPLQMEGVTAGDGSGQTADRRPQTADRRGRWRTKERVVAFRPEGISVPGVANGKQIAENIQQRHLVTLCDPLSVRVGTRCEVVVCCEPSLRRRGANRGLHTGSQRGRTSPSL